MKHLSLAQREALGELPNPLGLQGIEFVEYSCSRPQALGLQLEKLGFVLVARHRSREVLLYRQGAMNIIINAHQAPDTPALAAEPTLAAVAFRVRDAASAYQRVLALGAWAVPTQVAVMELNIPAIHGVGRSRIYWVDRWREFSIYDVDFVPIPGVAMQPPAQCGLHWFGLVQYIGFDRLADWVAFYRELFGFVELPAEQNFGVLTQGRILASPCGTLYWQLIEPDPDALETDPQELLHRIALGTPDVLATVGQLRQRGVEFVESPQGVHSDARGALCHHPALGLSIELVGHPVPAATGAAP